MSDRRPHKVFTEKKEFRPRYTVQITPDLPSAEAIGDCSVVVQGGPYGSVWVRVLCPLDSYALVRALVEDKETATTAALYVCFHQLSMDTDTTKFLLDRGFVFHHYFQATQEMIYYRWMHPTRADLVPAYGTSIEGAGLILLSPSEKEVLCTWEYNAWRYPGGAVAAGESALACAVRETKEEVGLDLDNEFQVRLVAGWNQERSRDNLLNDHYCLFLAKAKEGDIQVDGHEINKAKWVPIKELMAAFEGQDFAELATVMYKGEPYAEEMLRGLKNYLEGHYLGVIMKDRGYPCERHFFM